MVIHEVVGWRCSRPFGPKLGQLIATSNLSHGQIVARQADPLPPAISLVLTHTVYVYVYIHIHKYIVPIHINTLSLFSKGHKADAFPMHDSEQSLYTYTCTYMYLYMYVRWRKDRDEGEMKAWVYMCV